MKYFSLVTEILGGPQAETVKARKEKQGVYIDHPGFPPKQSNAGMQLFDLYCPAHPAEDFRVSVGTSNQQLP